MVRYGAAAYVWPPPGAWEEQEKGYQPRRRIKFKMKSAYPREYSNNKAAEAPAQIEDAQSGKPTLMDLIQQRDEAENAGDAKNAGAAGSVKSKAPSKPPSKALSEVPSKAPSKAPSKPPLKGPPKAPSKAP